MTALWLVLGLLGILIAAMLMQARRTRLNMQRAAFDLQVFRDQLREVERDRQRGMLNDEQAVAATAEIERRILVAADAEGLHPTIDSPMSRSVTTVVAVAVPIVAFAMYLQLGTPHAPDMPFAARDIVEPTAVAAEEAPEMAQMIARLEQRLSQSPEDAQGWLLLARSLLTVERHGAAVQAFANAIQYGGREPHVVSGYIEARVMDAGGRVDDATLALIAEVLGKDATNPAALYYAGLGRAQKNDLRGALQAWVDLAAVAPADAPWLADVRQRIAGTAAELGIDPGSVTPTDAVQAALAAAPPAPAEPAATTPAAPGPTREDMANAAQMAPNERMTMIRGMVEGLAARLEQESDDLDGWVRLERAYRVLGETEKADDAARRIAVLRSPTAAPAENAQQLRGPTQNDMDAAAEMSPEDRQEMIRNMVQGLVDRLKENPTDLGGWMMLERSYRVLGDINRADDVARRIEAMRGGNR